MTKQIRYILATTLCIFLCISLSGNLQAQKKRQRQSKETDLREAEFYFTEGQKYYILEDYAKALVLFQKALDITANNATLYYKIAQIHAEGDNLEKALENINTALSLEKDNKYFYVLAADINTQLGDFATAAALLEEMTARIEGTHQYLFELAALYLYQNRYDDALSTYSKIEKAYGVSEEVVTQKQKIYLKVNDIENALKEGKKLIELFPENDEYIIKQTEILFVNERESEAINFIEDFLKQTESARLRLMLSDLLRQQGKLDAAIENLKIAFEDPSLSVDQKIQLLAEFRSEFAQNEMQDVSLELSKKLTETHPEVADAYAVYGDILYAAGKNSEARLAYQKALSIDPSNFSLWQNTLQLLAESNKIDSLLILSDNALELFPNQAALYYFNGSAHLQKKNYDEAVAALEMGKRLSTANLGLVAAFNSMLGDAYNGAKQYEKSDRAYEAALEYDPDNYGLLNNYAYYLALRNEKLDKAEEMSSKAVKNNPENTTFLDTYAWVLYMQEKYKEARKVMEKALTLDGITAVHYEHYGDILYKLGEVDKAVAQWQKAKGLNPDSKIIDKKITDRKLYEQ